MRFLRLFLGSSLALALTAGQLTAQTVQPVEFIRRPVPAPISIPPGPDCATPVMPGPSSIPPGQMPGQTPMPGQLPGQAPGENPGAANPLAGMDNVGAGGQQASLAGTGGGGSTAAPHMIGDFAGYKATRIVLVPATQTITTTTLPLGTGGAPVVTTTTGKTLTAMIVSDAVTSRGGAGFKLTDNVSPVPQDRVFFNYNFFSNLQGDPGVAIPTTSAPVTTTNAFGQTVITQTSIAGGVVAPRTPSLHREIFGFEKAFLNNNASISVRLPMYQTSGDGSYGGSDFGDISTVFKYALINDRETGNVLATGVVVTAPTGQAIGTIDGGLNGWLFQPYFGFAYNFGDAYAQGFTSLIIPTNSLDTMFLSNDFGMGYYVYRNRGDDSLISAVVPTIELHVLTPLTNRSDFVTHVPNILDVTAGVHVGVGDRSWLTFAVGTPITGPRPYDYEAFMQFSYKF